MEIFCVECSAGLDEEQAGLVSGIQFFYPRQEGELKGSRRRSRIVAQGVRRLTARIRMLEELAGVEGLSFEEWLRHLRARAELCWAADVFRAGGVEPPALTGHTHAPLAEGSLTVRQRMAHVAEAGSLASRGSCRRDRCQAEHGATRCLPLPQQLPPHRRWAGWACD